MGKVSWQYSLFIEKSFNLYSQQDFAFKNSLVYARQFEKFEGAIVPNYCYLQHDAQFGTQRLDILHAVLPIDPNLTDCHKFLWSARHGDRSILIQEPDTLELFAVLTCIQRNQEQLQAGNLLYEEKVCDILFPGTWAITLYNKLLCLWYQNSLVLQRNSACPDGLLYANHPNLMVVLRSFGAL